MKKIFPLIHVEKPVLYEDIFDYDKVPKIVFDQESPAMNLPKNFWVTCTTFRDGQQARPPYTVEQIVTIYKMLHRLGGEKGVIRQCEYFLYSDNDKKAVDACRELGYKYPEITSWIRAKKEDFKLVKQMGIKETGILTSASDYHIFLKLNKTRQQAMDAYLGIVKAALEEGIVPRCHLEDITRADFYGFVIPFVNELMKLAAESKIPIKVRACDTMGYGLPFPNAALPRGIPKMMTAFVKDGGVPPEQLEWHGHNDFHKAHVNAQAAWLYGCAAANATLLGFGERTGNPSIEGLIMEYIGLKDSFEGIDTTVITEMGDYFKNVLKTAVPANYPFVGDEFNTTRAGIHADGSIKDERIYNIFNTKKLLNRPMGISITDKSGAAGIAYWINDFFHLQFGEKVEKTDPGVQKINEWVIEQYKGDRQTCISTQELIKITKNYMPSLFKSELEDLKARAKELAYEVMLEVVRRPEIISMDHVQQEPVLRELVAHHPFIKLVYVTDAKGMKITKNITQQHDTEAYDKKIHEHEDFSDRDWFKGALKRTKVYFTDLYTSKVTNLLCITVSSPIKDDEGKILGVLGIDIKFEDLIKL